VLVQAKVSPNGVDDDEAAPIDYALNLGHMCAVEILLALKADVTGFAGSRALWRAVHGGHISSVQRLLQVKVEVHGLSWPICAAVRNGSKPLIQLLVAAKATMTAHHHFLYAVCHGSSVQRLLEAKVDVHHARCSSLDGAILRGRVRPVQRLLQVDADVRDDRFDFLDLALCRGHVRIVQQLLDANAVLLYRSRIVFRHTPLLVAAKNGRVSVVQYLTRIKASLDHMDALHRTAMLVAANRGHAAVVQVLIAAKADMNVADLQLRTPAMIAARRGQVGVISHLLDAKADMDTPNQHGHTPLTIAQNVGQHAVVRLLTRQPAPSICASVETGP
jgi:ankyrin repeat protein